VLIADDHPLYCDALRAVVPQACPGADISEAGSQEEVLDAVSTPVPFDLVLLDLYLPGAVGLSCLHALKRAAPTTPIVVVSAVGDPKIMQEAIMCGASAFIPKSAPGQVLINALRVIIAAAPAHGELTLRQRRVLELLSTGLSNKRIARELDISEITVKAHVSAIFRKLGVANRMQASLEARRLLESH